MSLACAKIAESGLHGGAVMDGGAQQQFKHGKQLQHSSSSRKQV
jgi:hypothetical protein